MDQSEKNPFSELSSEERRALAFILSDEMCDLTIAEARKKLREKFGDEADRKLAERFVE